ncbi:extracellular solute-binding protein [Paenibacillus daejeonensis]|uniref:extracellular solute-binding protein n=1 Tax=Paenibacillus daejeonensis TaxID=135193 RepID=UPI0004780345|nr:extracellular solute-binding protein [Paenibacillus daejeonensis]
MSRRKLMNAPLALLVSAALVAGCSDNGGGGSTSGTDGEQSVKKQDITVSIYDRGNISQDEGTIENNRWTKWINENGPSNVKFVAIPRTNSSEKINVLFASGSAPDLLFEYAPTNRNPLYDQKQLMPIDELIEEHSVGYKKLLEENPLLRKAGTKSDGKLYEFGRINWVEPQRGILIRVDWLEKLGLEIPKTTDDLYTVAKAFAEQDPDGNGQKDTYGVSISGRGEITMKQIFGASTKWVVQDDELVIDWDRRQAYFSFIKQLYDEGIIDRDFINDENGAKAQQDFVNGKVGIYPFQEGNTVNLIKNFVDPLKQNVPDAELTFIPLPESEFGAFTPTLTNPVQMTAVIAATAKHPESVMHYIDFLIQEDTMERLAYGDEGTHYQKNGEVIEIIDADKHKKEVEDITLDMRMLQNSGLTFNKGSLPILKFNSDPRKEEYQEMYDLQRATYLTLDKPYPELTISEHMPAMPKDLATSDSNAEKSISDLWMKGVVGGTKYGIDQALAEAQGIWEKSDGAKIEAWYKDWYAENKDNALLAEDIYAMVAEQLEVYEALRQEVLN